MGNVVDQEQFLASLLTDFPGALVIDRRENPSHGYRAVHIIAEISGKPIEIQLRTSLQHLWAEVSEKSSDVLDPTIKYGGGPESWRVFLTRSSASVAAYEELEKKHSMAIASKQVADAAHEAFENAVGELTERQVPDHEAQALQRRLEESARKMERREEKDRQMRRELVRLLRVNTDLLNGAISRLNELKRQKE